MRQVTNRVDPASARDLLERAPRACISFAAGGGPCAQPVALVSRGGRLLAGVPAGARRPDPGQPVALLVDEGVRFFDLRAITIRGTVRPAEAPADAPEGRTWLEVVPERTVAWDYGALRDER